MSTVSLGYKIIEVAHLLYLPNYIAPYVHTMYEHTTGLSQQFEPCVNTLQASVRA